MRIAIAGVLLASTLLVPLRAPAAAVPAAERIIPFGGAASFAGDVPDDAMGAASTPSGAGLTVASASGAVTTLGDAAYHGSMPGPLNAPVLGVRRTPTGRGYWLVAGDGGVFTFGDAGFHGSTGAMALNQPVVGMTPTATGRGYWLVAADGGIFTFGDAAFYGSTGAMALNQPVVGMVATETGNGYWLVARDGGIFTFGDAVFHGSTGAMQLDVHVTGMARTATGRGYWLVAGDGGVFTFGDARFFGSAAGALPAGTAAVALESDPRGTGYWIVAARRTLRVAVAGDVHGERQIADELRRGGNPLAEVATLLRQADAAAVNLETPAGDAGVAQSKEFVFLAPPELLTAIKAAGIDVVTLANNHALDHGTTTLLDTIRRARAAGLAVVGAGANASEAYRPAYIDVRGQRIAFVGLSRVVPPGWAATATRPGIASAYDERSATAAVREAASHADAVVVLVHWGVELASCPGSDLIRLAGVLHAAGASVVAGSHPHLLQGIDARPEGTTAYSLGNFVWYHNHAPTDLTGVLDVTVDPGRRVDTAFHPARIGSDGHPRLLAGADADGVRRLVAGGPSGCRQ